MQNQTGKAQHCNIQYFRIMSNTDELIPELEYSQEANTCMMLHLAHISQYDFSCAVIATIEADVTSFALLPTTNSLCPCSAGLVPKVLFRN